MSIVIDFPVVAGEAVGAVVGDSPALPAATPKSTPTILLRYALIFQGIENQVASDDLARPQVNEEAKLALSGILTAAVAALDTMDLPDWADRFQHELNQLFEGGANARCIASRLRLAIAHSSEVQQPTTVEGPT